MKFVKGVVVGGLISAGVAWAYSEAMGMNKKKMMKKGKQFVKKMGII